MYFPDAAEAESNFPSKAKESFGASLTGGPNGIFSKGNGGLAVTGPAENFIPEMAVDIPLPMKVPAISIPPHLYGLNSNVPKETPSEPTRNVTLPKFVVACHWPSFGPAGVGVGGSGVAVGGTDVAVGGTDVAVGGAGVAVGVGVGAHEIETTKTNVPNNTFTFIFPPIRINFQRTRYIIGL